MLEEEADRFGLLVVEGETFVPSPDPTVFAMMLDDSFADDYALALDAGFLMSL